MGFWHTGYIEFHEPTGFGENYERAPEVFRCEICQEEHRTFDGLSAHRLEAHPFKRPVLFVAGREVPDVGLRVTRQLWTESVAVLHAETATVNGTSVSLDGLAAVLSVGSRDRYVVELQNRGVAATFSIDVAIAKREDVVGIELEFLRIARAQRLDMRAIEAFIETTDTFVTAAGYRNGICEYLYGVLAKERSADSSLLFAEYRVKFNAAVSALVDFDRPLANTIRGLVAFHFNQFELAAQLLPEQRVGVVAQHFNWFLRQPTRRLRPPSMTNADVGMEKMLSDFQTERILSWCCSASPFAGRENQLEALLQDDLAEFDRAKARLLTVEAMVEAGNVVPAATLAREVSNDSTFGAWAQRIVGLSRAAGGEVD